MNRINSFYPEQARRIVVAHYLAWVQIIDGIGAALVAMKTLFANRQFYGIEAKGGLAFSQIRGIFLRTYGTKMLESR